MPTGGFLGQNVDLTAQVSDCQDAFVIPQGKVTFIDKRNQTLGTVGLQGGFASLTISIKQLGIGSNTVTVNFTSADNFGQSSGSAIVTCYRHPRRRARACLTRAQRARARHAAPWHAPTGPAGQGHAVAGSNQAQLSRLTSKSRGPVWGLCRPDKTGQTEGDGVRPLVSNGAIRTAWAARGV